MTLKSSCCLTCMSAISSFEPAGHFDEHSMNFTPIKKKNPQLRTFLFPESGNNNMAGLRICDAQATILQFTFSFWSFTSKYITDKYTNLAKIKFVFECKPRAQHPWCCLLGSQIDCHSSYAVRSGTHVYNNTYVQIKYAVIFVSHSYNKTN